jgi:hypothetical protein
MADTQKLARELANLDDGDWFTVLTDAQAQRRDKHEQESSGQEPQPGVSNEQFAKWIAQRHLASDPDIREVIYLPSNAPEKEIRLLETNVLLNVSEEEKVGAVDFSPDINQLNFRVLVADITPRQWENIKSKKLALPEGWDLKDYILFKRNKQA